MRKGHEVYKFDAPDGRFEIREKKADRIDQSYFHHTFVATFDKEQDRDNILKAMLLGGYRIHSKKSWIRSIGRLPQDGIFDTEKHNEVSKLASLVHFPTSSHSLGEHRRAGCCIFWSFPYQGEPEKLTTRVIDGRTYFAGKPRSSKACWAALTDEERKQFEGAVDQYGKPVSAYSVFRFLEYEKRKGDRGDRDKPNEQDQKWLDEYKKRKKEKEADFQPGQKILLSRGKKPPIRVTVMETTKRSVKLEEKGWISRSEIERRLIVGAGGYVPPEDREEKDGTKDND